jgi:hypothetical protein
MVASGLLKRENIDHTVSQLLRQIKGLPIIIINKAIMNVVCSIRNAWEIVEPLANTAYVKSKRQRKFKHLSE